MRAPPANSALITGPRDSTGPKGRSTANRFDADRPAVAAEDGARPWRDLWPMLLLVAGVWGLFTALALAFRPVLPNDETRYLSVAWEMWRRNDWLVPYLGGRPYADKPPLLFWLMLGGWRVLGVNAWWPRLVAPLAGLASLILTSLLAARLWPARPALRWRAPLLLVTTLFWSAWSTLVMFDVLLTLGTLLALLGLVEVSREGRWTGWPAVAVGLAAALLTKGPIALVFVLPAVALAPLWLAPVPGRRWFRFSTSALLSIAAGAVPLTAWALAAADRGGPDYARALLVDQTVQRLAGAGTLNTHAHPWWWLLAAVPLVAVPLSLEGTFWRGLLTGRGRFDPARQPPDRGVRFCRAVLIPALFLLSLVHGKQAHYLVPLLPLFALLSARFWNADRRPEGR